MISRQTDSQCPPKNPTTKTSATPFPYSHNCACTLDDISTTNATIYILWPSGLIKCKLGTFVSINDCHVVSTAQFRDHRGILSVFEEFDGVPFRIRRVYCLSEVPPGTSRGGHAHKAIHQFVIAISGSFDLVLNDGKQSKRIQLLSITPDCK